MLEPTVTLGVSAALLFPGFLKSLNMKLVVHIDAALMNAAKGEGRARDVRRLEMSTEILPKLTPIADGLGCTLAQLAIAWAAANENVSTVILGATRLAQLEETLEAVDVIGQLTPEVMEEIEAALGTKPEGSEVTAQVVALRGPPARL